MAMAVFYMNQWKSFGYSRTCFDYFGMKPNQAVVFGDGYNDLSMFRPEWL